MANKPFENDIKVDVIDRDGPYVQESFDLPRLDNFVTGLGVEFFHYKAMPSPIGKNDRGDFRRSDGVDQGILGFKRLPTDSESSS